MAAVEVREWARTGISAPDVTGEASEREKRIIWRLAHLASWQSSIESLPHFDPEYVYDIGHEYEVDWTTDPDYSTDGVRKKEWDQAGNTVSPRDSAALKGMVHILKDAMALLGNRVEMEAELHFNPEIAEELGLYTKQGNPKRQVSPDLTVLDSAFTLDADVVRPVHECVCRVDQGDPVPEAILEILSPSTWIWDLEGKKRLYAKLGVKEYLVYDLVGIQADDSPADLTLFRLQGAQYHQVARDADRSETDCPAYRSEVFGRIIRIVEKDQPRLEWYDSDRDGGKGEWCDHLTEERDAQAAREARIKAETKSEAETELSIRMMHALLSPLLDRNHRVVIEDDWRQNGPPVDIPDKMAKVQKQPQMWRGLLRKSDIHAEEGTTNTP